MEATHKIGEEIMWDDPQPDRHNYTAYVCCHHFRMVMGRYVRCDQQPVQPHEQPASDLVAGIICVFIVMSLAAVCYFPIWLTR